MTATIPIVEHGIFDEGHPPVLQQIFPVSDNADSSQPFQDIAVPRWVLHASLTVALRLAQYARYSKSCLRSMTVIIERLAHVKEQTVLSGVLLASLGMALRLLQFFRLGHHAKFQLVQRRFRRIQSHALPEGRQTE